MRLHHFALVALVLLPGCAAILDGTEQTVTVRTAPIGAACTLQSGPVVVARIAATPATVVLHREKQDLAVVCQKSGWSTVATTIPSQFTGVTAGNIFGGGFIGIIVDEATRANYRYKEDTTILLTPASAGRPSAG